LRAYVLFDEILTSAGAPALTARRVDAGLDSPEAMRNLLTASGLDPLHIWSAELSHQWTPDTYWKLASGSGVNRTRLAALDDRTRADTMTRAQVRLAELETSDFAWTGEVVCAVASRPEHQR
jgi:hypothetical protein